jgi:hypothetical protein
MSLGPMNETTQEIVDAHNADRNSVQEGFEQLLGDLSTQTLSPPDSGTSVSSTQLIATAGVNYLNQHNKDWFKQNISNAVSLGYTRKTMLELMQNQILARFTNSQWITSNNQQEAGDIILRYLSEQYDLAAEEM